MAIVQIFASSSPRKRGPSSRTWNPREPMGREMGSRFRGNDDRGLRQEAVVLGGHFQHRIAARQHPQAQPRCLRPIDCHTRRQ